VIHVPAPDPFTVFGVPQSLELDGRTLERRYLELSRECHPDHNRAANAADCAAVLQRSAEINDAWRLLRDPWQRARALLQTRDATALDRTKKLSPTFLGEALELAEEVAFARPEQIQALRQRLEARLADAWRVLQQAFADHDHDLAARTLHECHYHQKALADLDRKP
jgi:molecular chaperone HscB